jgi:hypothetical protein
MDEISHKKVIIKVRKNNKAGPAYSYDDNFLNIPGLPHGDGLISTNCLGMASEIL